jgi:hypothetical protein
VAVWPEITARRVLACLDAGGGSFTVTDPAADERAAWRRAIHAAGMNRSLPPGTRLTHTGRDRGDLIVRLVPVNEPAAAPRIPSVDVPARLHRPHPLIAATRAQMETLPVVDGLLDGRRLCGVLRMHDSRPQLRRALRIGHGLFLASGLHGFEIRVGAGGGVCIAVKSHEYELLFVEEMDSKPHTPAPAELAYRERNPWRSIPSHDRFPSGRLQLRLPERFNRERHSWADRQRWMLEDKLGDVLVAIKRRAAVDEERRLEREQQARERREAWERAIERATEKVIEAHRVEVLKQRVAAWRVADDIQAWVAATRSAVADLELPPDVNEWLVWAETYADRIDTPSNGNAATTEGDARGAQTVPRQHQLKPFLGNISPYGPPAF